MNNLKILISGLYSGPSPSAGLGTARAIREAYPDATIAGLDYWSGSSGIHHQVFNEVILLPSWDLIDEATHIAFLRQKIAEGWFYLPTLDLEVEWLAANLCESRRVLAPSEATLRFTRKPRAEISELLPVRMPDFLPLSVGDEAVYEFCRKHAWRVWLKGPQHEAIFTSSWRALDAARQHLESKWGQGGLFVQAHKKGLEESICFAALNGRLLEAIHMEKRVTTPDGKTWSGKVGPLPTAMIQALAEALAKTEYHGGGEIELLRTSDGELWFNELNPRFPAWIFGSAIAGKNLPAILLENACGFSAQRPNVSHDEFTRVVTEIPVGGVTPLPAPAEPIHGQISMVGKYGAGMTALGEKIARHHRTLSSLDSSFISTDASRLSASDRLLLKDLTDASYATTPRRVFLKETAAENFAKIKRLHQAFGSSGFRAAYSLKTTCDPEILDAARASGMLAECISLFEVERALESGWRINEIVLNGPAKWWPRDMNAHDGMYAVFCDSLEEFTRLQTSDRSDKIWGARVRLPGFNSRFGIDLCVRENFDQLCKLFRLMPEDKQAGLHLHLASNLIGNPHWQDAVDSLVAWARAIEESVSRSFSVIDLGGGYHPDDLEAMPWDLITTYLHKNLPRLERIMIEPGRAVSQNAMAVVSSVLDIRRNGVRKGEKGTQGGISEVVLDSCIAELPLIAAYPHRFFLRKSDGSFVKLEKGATKVLGRICMEDDILSPGLAMPESLQIGDKIIIGDAGAYERSMSYEFGRGGY